MPVIPGGGPLTVERKPIDAYPSSAASRFSAAAGSAIDASPFIPFFAAGPGNPIGQAVAAGRIFGLDVPEAMGQETITGKEASERAAKYGLKYDIADNEQVSVQEADAVISLKRREKQRDALFARGPGGVGGFLTEAAGGLVGTLVDPAQIAASFIPVVGQARYAAALDRAGGALGRFGVRAQFGAVEGFVGSVVTEPLNFAYASNSQLRYEATDSFMNIAFGTFLGAGLHSLGGAVADAASGARRSAGRAPEITQRKALEQALVSADDGRAIDVRNVFVDPRQNPMNDNAFLAREVGRGLDVDEASIARAADDIVAVQNGVTERPADLVQAIKSMGGIRLTDKAGAVTPEGGDVRAIFDKRYPPGLVNNRDGVPLDYVREALQEQGWLPRAPDNAPDQTSTADVLELLSRWNGGDKPRHPDAGLVEDLAPVKSEIKAAGITRQDSSEAAAYKLAEYRARSAMTDALDEPVVMPAVYDPSTGYEPPSLNAQRQSAEMSVKRANAPDDYRSELEAETAAYQEMVAASVSRETFTAADQAALDLADAFEAQIDLTSQAYKAAQACLLGVA
jgi:hypothetical protein